MGGSKRVFIGKIVVPVTALPTRAPSAHLREASCKQASMRVMQKHMCVLLLNLIHVSNLIMNLHAQAGSGALG